MGVAANSEVPGRDPEMSVTPVPAATVILLRDTANGPETLLIERHARSEFLPDMYVFPGGRVEARDQALAGRLAGLEPEAAAALLPSVPAALALGFFVAAIRETVEEAGILLARSRATRAPIGAEQVLAFGAGRLEIQSGRASFVDLIEAQDLELCSDELAVHAHWITPEAAPRRFDTIFFCAVAPAGQRAAHDGVEATAHAWIRPERALEDFRAGRRQMIMPTELNLETLAGFETAAEALEASRRRVVVPVLPRVEQRDGVRRVSIPRDAGYSTHEQRIPNR